MTMGERAGGGEGDEDRDEDRDGTRSGCRERPRRLEPEARAGTARRGSAQRTATWSTAAAPRPTPIVAPGTRARTSIAYCVAAAVAVPPGSTRPRAPETSDDVTPGAMGETQLLESSSAGVRPAGVGHRAQQWPEEELSGRCQRERGIVAAGEISPV